VAAVAVALSACAEGASSVAQGTTATGTYESTRNLTGEALVDALGLVPLDVPRGVWVANDDPRLGDCASKDGVPATAGTVSARGEVYCLAGLVDGEVEEWDLAHRIAGHMPCALQVEAFRLSLRASELRLIGRNEEANELWDRSDSLKAEAKRSPDCS
jgi:hypothetical protein